MRCTKFSGIKINRSSNLVKTTRPSYKHWKKRTYQIVDFAVPVDHRIKLSESEKRDKYPDHARELKKTMEHENDGDTNRNWCSRLVTKGLVPGLEDLEIRRGVETNPNEIRDRPEYKEESWRLVETCGHSDSSEKPSTSKKEIITIIIIIQKSRRSKIMKFSKNIQDTSQYVGRL